jgi:3-dehydroquinate dehydratase/shikimate dehydrogenase
MTFIAASILIANLDRIESALRSAASAVWAGARLVEWRVDALADEDGAIPAVLGLVNRSPAPCIVTCRSQGEGGRFAGGESRRIALVEALAACDNPPCYVDLELAAWREDAELRRRILAVLPGTSGAGPTATSLILSSHDFTTRPPDLIQRVEAMTNDRGCSVIKVAWAARSLRDNLEAFDLLTGRRKPMIALCMGEFGLMSRVLAPKFGGLLTFAAPQAGEETAPGQPTVEELRSLYRFESISRQTKVYGVIGWPIAHSQSPHIHNAGFEAVEHDGVYLPLPIPPEWEHFKATVGALIDHAHLDFRGASVTLPHKENLLRFVTERGGRVDPLAERIGAANTLIVGSAGSTACLNTDAPAAIDSLCSHMRIGRKDLRGLRIAVLGAGGVARAVVAGLAEEGASVVVFNRNRERAEALAGEFDDRETASGRAAKVTAGEPNLLRRACFHIIVNCTSIGMAGGPAPDASPLDVLVAGSVPLDDRVTVFDTIYNPRQTPLIEDAAVRGARVITGLDMFIRQAAMQFEKWTGCELPDAVRGELSRDREP